MAWCFVGLILIRCQMLYAGLQYRLIKEPIIPQLQRKFFLGDEFVISSFAAANIEDM